MKHCSSSTESIPFLRPSLTVSFADVAHQTLIFDKNNETERLVLELIDTPWMQRLRNISQTGNTKLVYMFAEHSRFGHSLGVAYLAILLMNKLGYNHPDLVKPYRNAVAAAALLHDMGHIAPGSHLAERIWAPHTSCRHESISIRVISEDSEIRNILDRYDAGLADLVCSILRGCDSVPPWTRSILAGGGWNADRGNWAIVDSAMCSVSYGRYNVAALVDAFCLSQDGELVLRENRIDALTHFFVARDSMYRQVYQHRVLQAADALSQSIVLRIRDLLGSIPEQTEPKQNADELLNQYSIFCDQYMLQGLRSDNYAEKLPLSTIFHMTESWWNYHIDQWCSSGDKILSDLSQRLRDRRLFKTIRVDTESEGETSEDGLSLIEKAKQAAQSQGYDPRYYVTIVEGQDKHRVRSEQPPMVALDSGEVVPASSIEPMIDQIIKRPPTTRTWIALPKSIKEILGKCR